jgi:porin
MIDLNTEFDEQNAGAFFLNSSHGIGADFSQSGANGPSIFPTTAGAAALRYSDGPWAMKLGLFDATAGDPAHPRRTVFRLPGTTGLLTVGQIEYAVGKDVAIRAGVWRYSNRFERLVPGSGTAAVSAGGFATLEAKLAQVGERSLDGWLRVGGAARAVNPIAATAGGGLVFGDDRMRLGAAFAHARLGEPGVEAIRESGFIARRAETNLELGIGFRVLDQFWVQPDLQYVINPGFRGDLDDALVAGIRVIAELN